MSFLYITLTVISNIRSGITQHRVLAGCYPSYLLKEKCLVLAIGIPRSPIYTV